MRVVHDKKHANMFLQPFEMTTPVSSSSKITVTVPCAVNQDAIRSGAELVLFKTAPKAKAASRPVSVAMEPQARKQKIVGE